MHDLYIRVKCRKLAKQRPQNSKGGYRYLSRNVLHVYYVLQSCTSHNLEVFEVFLKELARQGKRTKQPFTRSTRELEVENERNRLSSDLRGIEYTLRTPRFVWAHTCTHAPDVCQHIVIYAKHKTLETSRRLTNVAFRNICCQGGLQTGSADLY